MDTELLLTFLTVAKSGGISAAARVLHRSQPAVTERLQKLSQMVGEPLTMRHGRGIQLTPAGEALLTTAQRMREVIDEFEDIILRRQRLQSGVLRIAATNTVANYFLPERLVAFQQQFPDVEIQLRGGVIDWESIALSDWDLFFLEGGLDLEGLPSYYAVTPWLDDEIMTIFPEGHALLQRDVLNLEDLMAYPLIWREPGSGIRRSVEKVFRDAGLNPRQSIEVTGVEAVGAAVDAGLGIGFVTAAALICRKDWRVQARRLPAPHGIQWTLYMARPQPAYQSHTIRAFLEFLETATVGLPLIGRYVINPDAEIHS
ncbi:MULTISPECIES: LysR family transcriptional regulator [Acidithiobacillus]|uniref:LysR family transcriptional regulator n=1 Tax=Acidithiobacillus TaxID=119977 RepID=UPI00187ADE70|nr:MULTISPECIES: LysR family transcriptional regulator [Acidithiobacillus]MBE7567084.1 LysR family transcriptional regulator [Acidithiobacillus sp. HP-11]MBU2792564.1 LysR family transcriptional regulator [Acidithiobacillus thiooxidans]